ncbi:RecQ family ATP-dependent DNA helicase [Marinicella litoralis]|uniref:ATP-dependent DNA helicase RecQ n=1 Tax=Marinicella litoralis TaxID=644220 RepID=A0A4R6XQ93_9GAMM|nr:RecQ family ATP-dependent DNA helicase [Marinicella litoralis]TDR20360.1 RecQ-like ATP-dependent DNA helicase [Marinicella litoralis]
MEVLETLKNNFAFDAFKPGQKQVIEKVLAQRSAAAIFPTGSGKSLCYQLPATQLPGLTLVVSPLLSLMKDQLDFLLKKNIKAARLDHSLERAEYNQVMSQAKNKQLKILMISVERFKNERFRAQLKHLDIGLLVIDEAHCISEWGHNFRPDYLKLPQYQKEFNIPQSLLLTATATPKVIADMRAKFSIDEDDVVVTGFYRNNLFLQMSPTLAVDRHEKLLARIKQDITAPTIVYVTLQKTAETVAAYLAANNIHAQHYHAGMKPDERELIQSQFMQGKLNVIVATIAFGMGIDKKDVRRVLHFDLPKSIENYSQEIGRAGRDDAASLCEIFANNDSLQVQENFVYGDTPEQTSIQQLLHQIQQTTEPFWETKLLSLSNELNIRTLPLKTLLVYLELAGIIKPKFTYFEEYSFKNINNTADLINRFTGERRHFIAAMFEHCVVKKTWTYVDVEAIITAYNTDRGRIMTALEWFDEQGMIELQAKQAVERFDIIERSFDLTVLSAQLHQLFINKEQAEIERIHNMLAMFESTSCLSKQLASYFGEELPIDACGHCSVCVTGPASFKIVQQSASLQALDLPSLSSEFIGKMGAAYTANNLTKFLCGIHTPVFSQLKIRALPHFGLLENHPFSEVRAWVASNEQNPR